ncbi:hypothetical protein MED222_05965 [Vibrio sp. MED222]|nr:hypothetical protein MED222_05965 [Vibrio sp. MED222]
MMWFAFTWQIYTVLSPRKRLRTTFRF